MNKLILSVLALFMAIVFVSCSKDDEIETRLTYEEQLAVDVEIIDNYLSDKGITAQIDSATGLRYVIADPGNGAKPNLGSNVVVKYEGRLLSNETVFDSNMDNSKDPLDFPLNRLIAGWQIGLPKIQEGGSMTLYIPSGLGYGRSGAGSIPANANLIFDIDLLEVK